MAIPFNLPSDEETEDNYRRLDQLLADLYHVLRQILLRSSTADGEEGREVPSRPGPVDDVRPRLDPDRLDPLPDVVSSTLDCPCTARRRRRRRRRECCQREQSQRDQTMTTRRTSTVAQVTRPPPPPPVPRENWLVVGEHLRKIAEEFRTFRKEEDQKEKEQNLQVQVKTSGLFSLLVPSHFRHSLWTTVILLVGWRILVRTR